MTRCAKEKGRALVLGLESMELVAGQISTDEVRVNSFRWIAGGVLEGVLRIPG